ncbi:unnamed protein product, partial [Rotaria magnacalcarata]
MSDSFINEIL